MNSPFKDLLKFSEQQETYLLIFIRVSSVTEVGTPLKPTISKVFIIPSPSIINSVNDTHIEQFDSIQKFIEILGWLLLTFFICLRNQLSSFNSIIVQMSEKHDSSSMQ